MGFHEFSVLVFQQQHPGDDLCRGGLSIDEVPKETRPDVFKRGWCSKWMMRLDISVDISYILVYLIVYVIYQNLSYIICVNIYIYTSVYIYIHI